MIPYYHLLDGGIMSQEAKKKTGRTFESKGVSAPPEWWDEVERISEETGINRSNLIRIAVDNYLKDSRKRDATPTVVLS